MLVKPDNFFNVSTQEHKISSQEIVFLVEGPDDCWFLGGVLKELGADPKRVVILSAGGKDNFPSALELLIKSGPYRQGSIKGVGLLRDADEDFSKSLTQTKQLMFQLNLPRLEHGAVLDVDKRMGFYMFPRDCMIGDLETLCLETVKESPIGQLSEQTLSEAEAIHLAPLDHRAKRQSQIYLSIVAGQRCRGVGRGYAVGHFDTNHQSLASLKEFVSKMIG